MDDSWLFTVLLLSLRAIFLLLCFRLDLQWHGYTKCIMTLYLYLYTNTHIPYTHTHIIIAWLYHTQTRANIHTPPVNIIVWGIQIIRIFTGTHCLPLSLFLFLCSLCLPQAEERTDQKQWHDDFILILFLFCFIMFFLFFVFKPWASLITHLNFTTFSLHYKHKFL